MVKFYNVFVGIFLLTFFINCKSEKKELSLNTLNSERIEYEDAAKVPVGKLGVFIVVDSLGVFEKDSEEFNKNPDQKIFSNLIKVNDQQEIEKYIETRAKKILTDQNKNFEFIALNPSIKAKEIYKPEFNASKYADFFKSLPYDDFLVVAIRSGINYDSINKLEGKTNIYISIIEKNNLKSKYYETLTGSKYLNEKEFKNSFDYQKHLIQESVEHTFDIIDKKY